MIDEGLIDEVDHLLKNGFTGLEKPLQSIGYKEALSYLNGHFKTIDECKEKIIISTRQLAKSQKTWFNRIQQKETFNPLVDSMIIEDKIKNFLRQG